MVMDIIKAIIVGVAASVPIGPIAILVIQKTLCNGFKPGYVTALGSTLVDTVYAVIAVFALTFVQDFIEGNSIPIFIGGGIIVIAMGASMALSNPFRKVKGSERLERNVTDGRIRPTDFLAACAMGLSNPGAIAVMFALMAFFGIAESRPQDWSFFPIVLGIAAGSAGYWLLVVLGLDHFRTKFNMKTIIWCNRIMGIIVVILGLATLGEGVMRIFIK